MSKVIAIKDTEFETEVLKADQPVLVYFWASWCGPCRLMSPLIEEAANNYSDRLKVVKMEVDPNPGTVTSYNGLVGAYTYSDMTGFALNSVGGGVAN